MEPIVYNESMSDKEIDRLVHQHVFGNPAAYMVPPYCSDVFRWWRVVEEMAERKVTITLSVFQPDRNTLAVIGDAGIDCGKMGRSVCVASLMHLGVMVDPEDVDEPVYVDGPLNIEFEPSGYTVGRLKPAKENAPVTETGASAESLAAAAGVGIEDHGSDPPQPCDVKECELPAGSCCG